MCRTDTRDAEMSESLLSRRRQVVVVKSSSNRRRDQAMSTKVRENRATVREGKAEGREEGSEAKSFAQKFAPGQTMIDSEAVG